MGTLLVGGLEGKPPGTGRQARARARARRDELHGAVLHVHRRQGEVLLHAHAHDTTTTAVFIVLKEVMSVPLAPWLSWLLGLSAPARVVAYGRGCRAAASSGTSIRPPGRTSRPCPWLPRRRPLSITIVLLNDDMSSDPCGFRCLRGRALASPYVGRAEAYGRPSRKLLSLSAAKAICHPQ